MGLVDLFRPKHRHSNIAVRAEAIEALTADDIAALQQVAASDRDPKLRRLALSKLEEPEVLAELAKREADDDLAVYAGQRAAKLWMVAASTGAADDASTRAAVDGILGVGEQSAIVDLATRATDGQVRQRAAAAVNEPRALLELVRKAPDNAMREQALQRLTDEDALRGLATDSTVKEIGLAALAKLTAAEALEAIAQRAKLKAVRQRARQRLDEATAASKAARPERARDERKQRRVAAKAQLLRDLDAVVETFDFAAGRLVAERTASEWQPWAADGADAELDQRFAAAQQRFTRRAEVAQAQAARAEKPVRRATPEVAPVVAAPVAEVAVAGEGDAPAAEVVPTIDPVREARRLEAEARRAAREDKRLADEARRAAIVAERAAKAEATLERSQELTAELTGLVDQLEARVANNDLRGIDALLGTAAKVYDGLGRISMPARDAFEARYQAARGTLVVRKETAREAEDWQRYSNVPRAEALVHDAEVLLAHDDASVLAPLLRELQTEWKQVGALPAAKSKELWARFKATCDQIYERVRAQRAVDDVKFAEVAAAKEALIAEAEALASSDQWGPTAAALKELQAKWKLSGHLPRKLGDPLWERFRGICDGFFARRAPELEATRANEAANLETKLALCARIEAIAAAAPGDGGWGKALGTVKDAQRDWREIGHVPRREVEPLFARFRAACDAVFAKREAARDEEVNGWRKRLTAVREELTLLASDVPRGWDGTTWIERAEAAKVSLAALYDEADGGEATARELTGLVHHMGRALASAPAAGLAGSSFDPARIASAHAELIKRAEALVPAASPASDGGGDVAARLKAAMRANAFGDLFAGRDPAQTVAELRRAWAEAGADLDTVDPGAAARRAKFDDVIGRVLGPARATAETQDPSAKPVVAAAPVVAVVAAPVVPVVAAPVVPVVAAPVAAADADLPRAKRPTFVPPVDDLDAAWDDDAAPPQPALDDHSSPPGSAEMAGDGAVEGDGLDAGWD